MLRPDGETECEFWRVLVKEDSLGMVIHQFNFYPGETPRHSISSIYDDEIKDYLKFGGDICEYRYAL